MVREIAEMIVPMSTPPTNPAPGAYYGMSFEDYEKVPYINWHLLEPFRVSSMFGRNAMLRPKDATKSMVAGAAFHTAVLEPEKFDSTYATMPMFDGHHNSNAYKEKKQAWLEHHSESVNLTGDELAVLRAQQRAVREHPTVRAILEAKGKNEISIFWKDPEYGVMCKGRIDRLCRVPAQVLDPNAVGDVICMTDFKTTVKPYEFDREVAKYGYHAQIASYESGLQTVQPGEVLPLIIAIPSVPPFDDVVVYTCADAVDNGRKLYRRLLRQYLECKATNRWPGICPVGTIPVILPKYSREPD